VLHARALAAGPASTWRSGLVGEELMCGHHSGRWGLASLSVNGTPLSGPVRKLVQLAGELPACQHPQGGLIIESVAAEKLDRPFEEKPGSDSVAEVSHETI
jgi:hypothetical protein